MSRLPIPPPPPARPSVRLLLLSCPLASLADPPSLPLTTSPSSASRLETTSGAPVSAPRRPPPIAARTEPFTGAIETSAGAELKFHVGVNQLRTLSGAHRPVPLQSGHVRPPAALCPLGQINLATPNMKCPVGVTCYWYYRGEAPMGPRPACACWAVDGGQWPVHSCQYQRDGTDGTPTLIKRPSDECETSNSVFCSRVGLS